SFRGPRLHFRVVGVNRDVADVEGEPATTIIATPAFDRAEHARAAAFGRALFIRRRADASAAQFQRELERAEPSHPLGDTGAAVEAKRARRAVTALTNGLFVFACVAAVVALVAIGQAVARHVAAAGTDEAVLEALGTTRRARLVAYVSTVGPVVLGATVIAV